MTFGSHALKWFHLLFDILMQRTCDLDAEVKKVPHVYPYIAMVEGESNVRFFQWLKRLSLVRVMDSLALSLIWFVCT